MTALIALSTAPDADTAKRIANALVENKHAACVQLVPNIESVYRWDGQVMIDSECQLIIKTNASAIESAHSLLVSLHPYDVPQWLVINDVSGSEAYLSWLNNEVSV